MRTSARILLAAALGAVAILPTQSASAVYCQFPFTQACQLICRVGQVAGAQCLD
jgi:hypothetical protein